MPPKQTCQLCVQRHKKCIRDESSATCNECQRVGINCVIAVGSRVALRALGSYKKFRLVTEASEPTPGSKTRASTPIPRKSSIPTSIPRVTRSQSNKLSRPTSGSESNRPSRASRNTTTRRRHKKSFEPTTPAESISTSTPAFNGDGGIISPESQPVPDKVAKTTPVEPIAQKTTELAVPTSIYDTIPPKPLQFQDSVLAPDIQFNTQEIAEAVVSTSTSHAIRPEFLQLQNDVRAALARPRLLPIFEASPVRTPVQKPIDSSSIEQPEWSPITPLDFGRSQTFSTKASETAEIENRTLIHELKDRYDLILGTLYLEIAVCLQEFGEADKSAWATDLKQMLSLLAAWRPGVDASHCGWAQVWTPAGSEIGRGSVSKEKADLWYLSPLEFKELLETNEPIRKCLIIRERWESRQDEDTIENFLREVNRMFGSTSVEIQDLSGGKKIPKRIPPQQYIDTIRNSLNGGRRLSKRQPPYNLLNLGANAVHAQHDTFAPPDIFAAAVSGHLDRFNLLAVLCQRADSTLKEMVSTRRDHIPESNAGKAKRSATFFGNNIDLQSCREFGLFAQRGCFSGWHVDVLNGTYVKCVAGLKAWFVHQHPLTDAEKEAFAKHGQHWQPDPSRVKLIILQPGDTFYMPAGELVPHAPITVFDCLMRGGMRWDTLRISDILANIAWIAKNGVVTNEPIPAQLIACWNELEKLIKTDPEMVEMQPRVDTPMDQDAGGDTPMADIPAQVPLGVFFDKITKEMKEKLSCDCGRNKCADKCKCQKNEASDLKCTPWCHPKTKNREPRPCMISCMIRSNQG